MDISLEWHRFDELPAALLYEVLRFRQAVFVVEQVSAYEDLDGRDQAALHLLSYIDGTLAGCLRLVVEEDRVRIGRLAVARQYRGRGLAQRMMAEAFARIGRDHSPCPIAISAQSYLVPFYAGLGFAPNSPEYDDGGVPHIDMVRPPLL
jgi:ElaA protein